MLSSRYLLIPFVLQIICMGVDELYFHHQRKLPWWERIGHPLDTLTVLSCFFWIWFVPPTQNAVLVYVILSVFSSLFVTKDEWVHKQLCKAGEHWIHALQFTIHPFVLLSAGLLWPALHERTLTIVRYEGFERLFLIGNLWLTICFGLYQLIYWNLIWRPASTNK